MSIVLHKETAKVELAYCICPAGLYGCCNHVTATLYCLEDCIDCGLCEAERLGCAEKLQAWNQPRKKRVEPGQQRIFTGSNTSTWRPKEGENETPT